MAKFSGKDIKRKQRRFQALGAKREVSLRQTMYASGIVNHASGSESQKTLTSSNPTGEKIKVDKSRQKVRNESG